MRVGEDALKSVGFIGRVNNGVFTPCGTGFLGGITKGNATSVVIVTAAHVLDGPSDDFCVRLTDRTGQSLPVRFDRSTAYTHPDLSNDIAIVSLMADPSVFDFKLIRLERETYENYLKTHVKPEVGEVVSMVGLYTSHHGLERNAPVVRTGNIAAMPAEPVKTETGYVKAYLVETRSIAGLSGSPVYLNAPPLRVSPKGDLEILDKPSLYPMGLMLGYHVVESREDQIQVPQFQKSAEDRNERRPPSLDERNTGFGVVVPIERVFEIMEGDRVQNAIKNAVNLKMKNSGFRPASASPQPSVDAANPNHKEDFTALLGAAARKPK